MTVTVASVGTGVVMCTVVKIVEAFVTVGHARLQEDTKEPTYEASLVSLTRRYPVFEVYVFCEIFCKSPVKVPIFVGQFDDDVQV